MIQHQQKTKEYTMNYLALRRAELEGARQDRERASLRLELASIRERLEEMIEQHEPIGGLLIAGGKLPDDYAERREQITRAAQYVVYGRMPEKGDQ